jgi:hypothetical protein
MQNEVMAKLADPEVRAYVVWVPMFFGAERDVPRATTELPDPRASHYWDGDSLLVQGYRETLKFNEPAWDIFLLYAPEAKWEGDRPPAPAYWMHQLLSGNRARVPGPILDGPTFLAETRRLIERSRMEGSTQP